MPGHARAVEGRGWKKPKRFEEKFPYKVGFTKSRDTTLRISNKPERCCMKRLTEWINLIAAIIRLIYVIIRTGWV